MLYFFSAMPSELPVLNPTTCGLQHKSSAVTILEVSRELLLGKRSNTLQAFLVTSLFQEVSHFSKMLLLHHNLLRYGI